MKKYKVLIEIRADNEIELQTQLEALNCYNVEWWCEAKDGGKNG